MEPKTISTETIYNGKVFDIRVDEVREGDFEYKRDVVAHKGSAVVIPVFDDGTVTLVRQYRHAAGEFLLELCAGTLEKGESPEACAARELEEEIGLRAERLEKISEFYVSPGFLTEKMHVYMATGLSETQQNPEDDEILTIERHPLAALMKMVENGEIKDAKTIVGLMLVERRGSSFLRS